ncbi:hypothetical protein LY474_27635 [Myxococcus stipitatus]|uniref:hypothetical protein n=1 Tax=Myxococcus stipitatus TaxID=83455 RepID=UPI001F32EF8A|nr:hypothetical protein [Myxococcus stipitatus]MCE9671584.1 hypothetical protein [Myxococcus stipitatus]
MPLLAAPVPLLPAPRPFMDAMFAPGGSGMDSTVHALMLERDGKRSASASHGSSSPPPQLEFKERRSLSPLEMFGASALVSGALPVATGGATASAAGAGVNAPMVVAYGGQPPPPRLMAFLRTLPRIRVYIEESINYGHQTNTLNVLYTLRSIGYRGEFQIVVARRELVEDLRGMFPWIDRDPAVTWVEREDFDPETERLPLCLTGGFDNNDNEALDEPAKAMGVNCFVALQPYRFEELSTPSRPMLYLMSTAELWNDPNPAIRARGVDLLRQVDGFSEMAYLPPHVPRTFAECHQLLGGTTTGWATPVSDDVLATHTLSQQQRLLWPRRTHNQLCLFAVLSSGHYHYAGVYGLAKNLSLKEDHSAEILYRYSTMVSICEQRRKPAVIVVFQSSIDEVGLRSRLAREGYWSVGVAKMPDFNSATDANRFLATELEAAGNEVLVLVVGPARQSLFNYCFTYGDLPCIFEGEGSAPLAFGRGRPFLYMKGPQAKSGRTFYPALDGRATKFAASLQRVSRALWDTAIPIHQARGLLFGFLKHSFDETSLLCRYFRDVARYYANPAHNRCFMALLEALDLLEHLEKLEGPREVAAAAAAVAAAARDAESDSKRN